MKICLKCSKRRRASEFHKNRAMKDGLQAWCKTCNSSAVRRWCAKKSNKRHRRRHAQITRREKSLYIFEYLKAHPCVDCKESDPLVLDFDHVRGQKLFTISRARSLNLSLLVIKKEISKCKVRCANCHRRRTAKQFGHYRLKWAQQMVA